MHRMVRSIARGAVLAAAAAALAACVYAPPPPAYGYGYGAPGYYTAPGYYYPPVVGSVNLGFGYWGGRGWR